MSAGVLDGGRVAVLDRFDDVVPIFGDVTALVGRRLRHLRRSPGKLLAVALNPLVMIVALGYLFEASIVVPGGGTYQEYIFAGVAAQIGLTAIGPTAVGMAEDLRNGLVDRFRTLSISRAAVLIGHTVADLILSAVTLLLVTGMGVLLGWRPHNGLGQTVAGFALLLLFSYATLWVGVLLGLVMRSLESIESTGSLLLVLFSFVSNAFLSTERMPGWLGAVAEWNPLSCVAAACRHLWGNPIAASGSLPSEQPVLVAMVVLALMMVITVPLAVRAFSTAATR
ncbi:ABC transporter permease [Micromonospora sp. NBC_01796]|uniref:ABC transporter permease n=1 Tax=Micromonospora sp. NBC_01796 TaxID=2975987 RepID=UPI002DD8B9E4|nr:ABC transporter permease [Micromonospora sp. NBC_01796]WSA85935.1 ABC transporter permease [Micromonospora sp. NBC_01796]